MKYAIFGAGVDGKRVLQYLGHRCVVCVIDNYKNGEIIDGIDVISLSDFLNEYDSSIRVLVASTKFKDEMVQELRGNGFLNYEVFEMGYIPEWRLWGRTIIPSIERRIPEEKVSKSKHIGIFGFEENLKFIYNEINEINPDANVEIMNDKTMIDDFDLVVVNSFLKDSDIRAELIKRHVNYLDLNDIERHTECFWRPELACFRNKHKGKRVFLIGNGPSLKLEDLETLRRNDEITIAANKIYRVYDEVSFRPTYLAFSDYRIIMDLEDIIPHLPGIKLVHDWNRSKYTNQEDNIFYFSDIWDYNNDFLPYHPRFSDDITRGVYWGASVLYDVGIQWAAYMGASEIYLLGVDHNFIGNVTNEQNHFIKDYYKEKGKNDSKYNERFQEEELTKAFEMAEIYSRANGFRIYNATRGGKLEVFERVNFDSLF